MSSDDPIASGNQLVITRKVSAMERPVRMIVQLLIALVEAIRGREECNGIRNMNRHRKIKLAAGIPHRIKTRVINSHQRTGGYVFTKIESQRLENLKTSPAVARRSPDGLCLQLRVVRFFEAGIGGLGESVKAAGICTVVFGDGFDQ